MGRDTPTGSKDATDRGFHANHAGDPTFASYLSSVLFVLSVPGFVLAAYAGHWTGLYPSPWIPGVFGGLLFVTLVLVFAVMHALTGR